MRTAKNLLLAAATLLAVMACAQTSVQAPSSSTLQVGAGIAEVQTSNGKVQGLIRNGIYNFRGMTYATAGRFEAPVKPARWDDTRLAISYGLICPQATSALSEPQAFLSDWKFWPQGENCLNLNVWTPNPDGAKRPVMVWLHGGGFFSGSSIELPVYEGTNLSRMGDVVVVSVNHRLNILGHLDLSAHGGAYGASGNAGMQDIVAALEWVKENIAAFGGDPDNVTIFGQSGGGAKVSTMLAAPSAQGLFHKAIVMSGAGSGASNQATARRVAELTFQHAGLANGDIAGLKAISYEALTAAGGKALAEASRELSPAGATGGPMGFPRVNWGPVTDNVFLTGRQFDPRADGVPLMIGSTLSEFQLINPRMKGRETWPQEQLSAFLKDAYGDRTDAVIAAFQNAYPDLPLSDIPAVDTRGRPGALAMAGAKAAQAAPVYNYLFAWRAPVLDYGWAAGHTSDVGFVFDNAEAGIQSTGGGAAVDALTRRMTQAWINFARVGDPNHSGLPVWPEFTAEAPTTMVFDNASWIGAGHDADLLRLIAPPPAP